jgi:hypothetical protein
MSNSADFIELVLSYTELGSWNEGIFSQTVVSCKSNRAGCTHRASERGSSGTNRIHCAIVYPDLDMVLDQVQVCVHSSQGRTRRRSWRGS